MKNLTLPDDPLLDAAVADPDPYLERSSAEPHGEGDNAEDRGRDGTEQPEQSHTGSNEDDTDAPNTHKRPRLDDCDNLAGDNGNHGNHGHLGQLVFRGNGLAPAIQASLRQYAPGIASSKKLRDNSVQELHRFATSSAPEREMMAFALNLEIRDILEGVSNAVVTSNVHPDLRKHIKTYAAALFFSPSLPYYSVPRGGARNKELQRTVLNMLAACQVANLPPASNHTATDKVLATIGADLTDLRSNVKQELGKRKQGASNVDLGTFVANLTRNTTIKVTKEHYGRVAFLSREYRRWESRDTSMDGGLANVGFWDWVDAALDKARKKHGRQADAVNRFFQTIIEEDERLFSKAVGKVASPEERDDWQKQIELASGVLRVANN